MCNFITGSLNDLSKNLNDKNNVQNFSRLRVDLCCAYFSLLLYQLLASYNNFDIASLIYP